MTVIPLVKGTHTFKVMKKDGEKLRACFWYEGGIKLDEFQKEPAPTLEVLRERWGRGEYRLSCLATDRHSLGMTKTYRIDDPALPDRGFYPNDPALAAAAVVPVPVLPVVPPVDPSKPPVGVTQVPIEVFHYLFTLAKSAADSTIEQSRQMHALELQRLEHAHALTLAQTNAYWSAQAKMAAEVKGQDPALLALAAKLEDLEESIEEGREETETQSAPMVPASLASALADPLVAGSLQELPKLLPALVMKAHAWLKTVD